MKAIILALFMGGAALSAAPASALDKPEGKVILTLTGHLANTNGEGVAAFDLAMLEALAGRKGTMETPWTEGKVTFSGPFLRSVLEAAGADGSKLIVKALNDYAADVPLEDADTDVILATRENGEEMSVRDKGPLFMIYPFDEDKSFYTEQYFNRSVWQIKEIEVVE